MYSFADKAVPEISNLVYAFDWALQNFSNPVSGLYVVIYDHPTLFMKKNQRVAVTANTFLLG